MVTKAKKAIKTPEKEVEEKEKQVVAKCSNKGLCTPMLDRLVHSGGAGFSVQRMFNTSTMNGYTSTPVFKMSAKDKGVYINFCPFCGVDCIEIFKTRQQEAIDAPMGSIRP